MKSKIYTKTGDKGQTSLVGGQRLMKSDSRIALYGELDELNSYIGLALSFTSENIPKECTSFLIHLQNLIFDLGSTTACLESEREKFKLKKILEADVSNIENEIDRVSKDLPELKNFILPGGTSMASALHICRTVTRRVERNMIAFKSMHENEISDVEIKFLNRLSDYFFSVSRYVNLKENRVEIGWNIK